MKKLFIVRHAKAVPYGYEDDFTRGLTERGERDAEKVSRALLHAGLVPDLLITSPASRALQTAKIFAGTFSYPLIQLQKEENLYMEFTSADFFDFLTGIDNRFQTVGVFGHNPGVSYFAGSLLDRFNEALPTCGTVVIEFAIDRWVDLQPRSGRKILQLFPKALG